MNNEKIAEALLAETRTQQEAYEYSIKRQKGIERSKTTKINPIGPTSPVTIKQEPMGYIQSRGGRFSRTTMEENTRVEDKTKTQEEIKTEVRRTTLLKNSVISVEILLALTIYKRAQPEIKVARNMQNGDTLQESVFQIM